MADYLNVLFPGKDIERKKDVERGGGKIEVPRKDFHSASRKTTVLTQTTPSHRPATPSLPLCAHLPP